MRYSRLYEIVEDICITTPTVTYAQLLVAAGKAEAEVNNGKLGKMTIKAKAATANDELLSLKQQVSVVKAYHV